MINGSYCYSSNSGCNWMDEEAQKDYSLISGNKDKIVSGYLGIGKKDVKNVEDGAPALLGLSFARFMLRKFWHTHSTSLCEYKDIFERAIRSYSLLLQKKSQPNELPRIYLDGNSLGWQKHLVVRMVGNVGSSFNEKGPFFEIMINSALNFGSEKCYPFDAVILENAIVASARKEKLNYLNVMPETIGFNVTYYDNLPSPMQFIETYESQHGKSPGPNSMRLLEGLKLLNIVEMKGQTVGNCWMKQSKRSILATLFIETLTLRPEINPKQALELSKKLYKKWTAFNRIETKEMIIEGGIPLELATAALAKIKKKRK